MFMVKYKSIKSYVIPYILYSVLISSLLGCVSSAQRFRFEKEVKKEDDNNINLVKKPLLSLDEKYKVMSEILKLIGTPHKYNGMDSTGIDCSGFTLLIFQKALDISLPRSTTEQYQAGTLVNDSLREFGDLVFFNTKGEAPSHVGIYLDENLFAHASVSYGVTISSLENNYYEKRYICTKRVK